MYILPILYFPQLNIQMKTKLFFSLLKYFLFKEWKGLCGTWCLGNFPNWIGKVEKGPQIVIQGNFDGVIMALLLSPSLPKRGVQIKTKWYSYFFQVFSLKTEETPA